MHNYAFIGIKDRYINMDFPFKQIESDGKIIRTFTKDVDDEELKWHFDLEDRWVTILESNGWSFQFDNGLPTKLENQDKLYIPKLVWHRVIKGDGNLVVSIQE